MVHVTNWPQEHLQPAVPVESLGDAHLALWQTHPRDQRAIPPPDDEGVLFATSTFSLVNGGNRTARAPKRSWKINFEPGHDDDRLVGMSRLNLKAMYNDPSQMREALAWRLFDKVGVPSSRHTYAKLAINDRYMGLFSLIEQVDRRFLRDHFGKNDRGNLYKAYCGDIGSATLEHRVGNDGDDGGHQYLEVGSKDKTYRLKTNEDDGSANTYDDLARFIRTINGIGLPGGDDRSDSDAFRESAEDTLNVNGFLRWASLNLLIGSWDNYFATPANYFLLTTRDGRAARKTSSGHPTSLSYHGTTTTASVSTTSSPNGSTPTSSTGRATRPTFGALVPGPPEIPWSRTCCGTATSSSTTWTIWSTCSILPSLLTQSPPRLVLTATVGCGIASATRPT